MTATITRAPERVTPGRRLPVETFTGYGEMVRLILRRNWLRLSIWAIALIGMVGLTFESQRVAFPTQAARDAYAEVANTPAVAALTGLPYAAGSLGGILVIKIWMTIAIALAFASIFLVTRNGRAEEEAGRTELLRSGVLGHHAYSFANTLVVAGLNVVVGLGIALACLALGLPAEGSLVMGASIAGVGLAFLGIAAVAGQFASTSRGANTLASTVLGVFYLVRAAADLDADGTKASPLSWASPIGWAQNMRAFGENDWWPVALLLALAIGGCVLATRLESRRDLGAGMIPDRPGPSRASAFTTTPIGLTVRLQRGSIIGWTIAGAATGLFFGGVATAMSELLTPDNAFAAAFVGEGADVAVDNVLALFAMLNGLVAGAFAVQSAIGARAEEAAGRLEPQLAGALSRPRWAAARFLVPAVCSGVILAVSGFLLGAAYGASQGDSAAAWRLAGASLAYWPTVLLLIGVVVFMTGWIPRRSTLVSWIVFAACLLTAMFGDLFSLPQEFIDATPFGATPRLPAEQFDAMPLVVLGAIAIALWTLGLLRFRARDLVQD